MSARDVNYKLALKNPMTDEDVKDVDSKTMTIQHLMFDAITRPQQGDENLSASEKMQLHSIATKIAQGKQLKASALVKVKQRALKVMSIIAYGALCQEINEALGEAVEPDAET